MLLIQISFVFVLLVDAAADSTLSDISDNQGDVRAVINAPGYRDVVSQGVDPTRPADPSLVGYTKSSASYRTNAPPYPTNAPPYLTNTPSYPSNTPSYPPNTPTFLTPQYKVMDNEFRVPNNTDGVIQNITVVIPSHSPGLPSKNFYDQLAQGKAPFVNKKRAVCCAPGFATVYNSRGYIAYDPPAVVNPVYPLNVVNRGFIVIPQPIPISPLLDPIPIVVDIEWLDRALMNRRRIRLLDATPSQERYNIDYRAFRDEYYGKFDRLFAERPNLEFQRLHIPTAVHFNFDIATYPAWNDPSALYPPEIFQQYVRRLGVNEDDHIVVYSRGTLGGMLNSARVWNLFRIYGHYKVSVLDGGLEAWRGANLTLTDLGDPIIPGNWTARFDPSLVIAYEDLSIPGADGFCVLNRLSWYNFLDARPKPDYYGLLPIINNQRLPIQNNQQLPVQNQQQSPPNGQIPPPLPPPRRSHVPGAKSLPAEDLVRPDGFMLPIIEIKTRLQQAGYQPGRESIAAGNIPEEASMVALALALAQDPKVRLYNAGIPEMRLRIPQLINAK